jgi:hypothetical protein
MRQVLFVVLMALTIVSGTQAFSQDRFSPSRFDQIADPVNLVDDPALMLDDGFSEKILAADGSQNKAKYTCLETCAKGRYNCERTDKNKPGSKENLKASSKCQLQYINCMDRCQ